MFKNLTIELLLSQKNIFQNLLTPEIILMWIIKLLGLDEFFKRPFHAWFFIFLSNFFKYVFPYGIIRLMENHFRK